MRLKIRFPMILVLCLAAWLLSAGAVLAQSLVQYTPPGGPAEKPESRQEELERRLAAARYRLGPLRIAPWATLRDVAYVRSLLAEGERLPNDLTATVGAGFRAYLRNGPKATWSAQVLPEYVWWQRQTERRQLNGRYLLGFAGYFNHLTVEAQAGRQQQQQIVTPEVPVPVSSRNDGGELLVELRLTQAFSLFATAALSRQNNLVEDVADPLTAELRRLDRDERTERLGVRWRPRPEWTIGVAGEHMETDFTRRGGAFDRSNAGDAPVVETRFRGNRLGFEAEVADRSLTARRGAELVPFHGVTGSAAVRLGGEQARASVSLYSSRSLVYSLSALYPYLVDERVGTAFGVALGQRTQGRLFVEGGHNDYTPFSAATPGLREDVLSYGGSLVVELRRSLRLGLQGLRSRYDTRPAGGSRSYTSVGATITLVDLPGAP